MRGGVANRGAITVSIMLATIMQGVDNTIANVALPHIRGSLSASQDQIAWVLTSYIVAVAITTPLTGWLAGRLGIKYVFLVSVAGFTLASALCGSATSLTQLVIYRLLQGVCGAALVPLSQSVLLQINPPERHGQAIAVWGIGVMLGPICGPMLGGWLTEDFNWRWIFYINLPVGVIASLGILIFIRETGRGHREAFDFFGFASLSVAIGALQMMLDRGQLKDWFSSTEIMIEAMIAGVALYLFIVHTATATDRSFLNRDLLKSPNFAAGTILMFFVGGILSGTLALVPTMLQSLMNYPVFTTGLITAPRGIGTMIAMFIVGRIINKIDNRLIILIGPCADGDFAVADDRLLARHGDGAGRHLRDAAGLRARLHLCPAEHDGALEPAEAPSDPGDCAQEPDAEPRRQHRHLDLRGAVGLEHPDRPFAAGRASAPGQPARPPAAPRGALQPDLALGHRRTQCRGDAAGGDGGLYRRFRADDDDRRRLDPAVASGAPGAGRQAKPGRCRRAQPAGRARGLAAAFPVSAAQHCCFSARRGIRIGSGGAHR